MAEELAIKWVVLKRVNGHAEPVGQTIQLFDDEALALEEARRLAERHHGTKFAVFELIGQRTYEAVLKQEDVA